MVKKLNSIIALVLCCLLIACGGGSSSQSDPLPAENVSEGQNNPENPGAGGQGSANNSIPTPPLDPLALTISGPTEGSFVNIAQQSTTKITGSCDQANETIRFKVGSEEVGQATCDGTSFESENLDFQNVAEGALVISAEITNQAGASGTASLNLVKDTVAPSVTVGGLSLGASSSASGPCSENNRQVIVTVNGSPLIPVNCVNNFYVTGTFFVSSGSPSFTASQTDEARNTTVTPSNFNISINQSR